MRARIPLSMSLLAVCTTALAFSTLDAGGPPTRWANAHCTMYHDPSWSAFPSYISELRNAMTPWSSVSGSNFEFSLGGASLSTDLTSHSNGSSDVYFGDLSANTYAVTWISQSGPTLSDRDVEFNTDWTWSTNGGSGIDFRSIAVHELGHVLGLGHESGKAAVMRPYYDATFLMHTLQFDDEEGCRFLYPEPPPPPPPVTDTVIDLVIGAVTFVLPDDDESDEVSVSFSMHNAGADPTGSFAATVYLTEGTQVTPDDRYLRARLQSSLAPGETRGTTMLVRLPDGLEPRIYRIGVILDAQQATGDRDRSNNAAVALQVIQGGGDALVIGPGYRVTGKLIPFGRESFTMELTAGTKLEVRSTLEGGSVELSVVQESSGTVLVERRRYRRANARLKVPEDGTYVVHLDSQNATANDYELQIRAKTIRITGSLTVTQANQLHVPGYLGCTVDAKVKAEGDVQPTVEWAGIDATPDANRRGTRVKLRRALIPATGPLVLVLSQGDGPSGEVAYRIRLRIPKKGPLIQR